jgi:hypothetical protein
MTRGRFQSDPLEELNARFTEKVYPALLRHASRQLWYVRPGTEAWDEALQEASCFAWQLLLDRAQRRIAPSHIAKYALARLREGRQSARNGQGYTASRWALESVTRRGREANPKRRAMLASLDDGNEEVRRSYGAMVSPVISGGICR